MRIFFFLWLALATVGCKPEEPVTVSTPAEKAVTVDEAALRLVLEGEPSQRFLDATKRLQAALSVTEQAYLVYLDWATLEPELLIDDSVFKKALLAIYDESSRSPAGFESLSGYESLSSHTDLQASANHIKDGLAASKKVILGLSATYIGVGSAVSAVAFISASGVAVVPAVLFAAAVVLAIDGAEVTSDGVIALARTCGKALSIYSLSNVACGTPCQETLFTCLNLGNDWSMKQNACAQKSAVDSEHGCLGFSTWSALEGQCVPKAFVSLLDIKGVWSSSDNSARIEIGGRMIRWQGAAYFEYGTIAETDLARNRLTVRVTLATVDGVQIDIPVEERVQTFLIENYDGDSATFTGPCNGCSTYYVKL